MALDGKVQIGVDFDSADITKGISQIKTQTNGLTSVFTKLGKLVTLVFSVRIIYKYLKAWQDLYNIQLANEIKLATVMRQRMQATDDEIKSILQLTSAEQQLGIVGDEVQIAGAQQLSTFLKQTESLETLIPAMNNLIAQQKGFNATSEDAVSIGNMFGKVMQGQTTALKRVGITFTEAEENALKYGNELDRAKTLAQIITNNVGEMNYALAQTDAGRQKQLSNVMGDIQEQFGAVVTQLGTLILPLFQALANILAKIAGFARMISQYIANVFGKQKENTSSAKQQATAIGVSAKNENKLADATKKAGKNAKGSVASFDEIEKLTSEATENAEELAEETADTEIGGGDVGVGFNLGINEEIDTTPIDNLVNRIKGKFAGLKETFAPLIETLSTGIRKYADTWRNIWSTILSPIIENYKKNIDTLWDNHLSKLAKNILDLIVTIIDGALQLYNDAFLPLVNFLIDKFGPTFVEIFNFISNIVFEISGYIIDVIDGIITVLRGIIDFIVGVFTGDWEKAWQGIVEIVQGVWTAIKNILKGIINLIIDAINAMIGAVESAFNKIVNRVNGIIESINSMSEHIGFTLPYLPTANLSRIPKLAQGGVVPPNNEFLAIFGDNKKETEIVSPLSTMIQAFETALSTMNTQRDVIIELDGREMGKTMVNLFNRENRRIGGTLING